MPFVAVPGKLRMIVPPVPVVPIALRAKFGWVPLPLKSTLLTAKSIVPPFPLPSGATVMPVRALVNVPPAVTVKEFAWLRPDKISVACPAAPDTMLPFLALAAKVTLAPAPVVRLPGVPEILRLPARFWIVKALVALVELAPPVMLKLLVLNVSEVALMEPALEV